MTIDPKHRRAGGRARRSTGAPLAQLPVRLRMVLHHLLGEVPDILVAGPPAGEHAQGNFGHPALGGLLHELLGRCGLAVIRGAVAVTIPIPIDGAIPVAIPTCRKVELIPDAMPLRCG